MIGKKLKMATSLFLVAFTLFALFPAPAVQAAEVESPYRQDIGTNLLVNPGLEGIGRSIDNSTPNSGNWTRDTFTGAQYGEIFTPEGWVTWWEEGEYKRPECKVIPNEAPFNGDPNRIYAGYYSGMCFTFFGKQNAGYYQVVRNIPAGSLVEASFYAHAWSCSDDSPPLSCGDPYSFSFQVGIDPNGGTDPFSTSIVWSAPYYLPDTYGKVGPVQTTVGGAGAATMYVKAYGKWSLKHNDAYFDNMALTMLTPAETPTLTPEPPPPTSETPPTPRATPTPRPDGAIVHEVVSGDTLFGLAIAYGIDVQQIYDLNDLDSSSLLSIGQDIVISVSGDIVPTPTPQAPEETVEAEQPAEPATDQPAEGNGGVPASPATGKAAVCVLAFYDDNGDMFRQPAEGEMLLPNAQINMLAQSGPVDNYTTDGISEPWCFDNLEPGNYILRHTPPPGYTLTDGGQWNFVLGADQVLNIELAYTRDAGAVPGGDGGEADLAATENAPEEDENGGGSGVTNVLNVVLRVSGFIVLALAIAVLVLFVLSRRSA